MFYVSIAKKASGNRPDRGTSFRGHLLRKSRKIKFMTVCYAELQKHLPFVSGKRHWSAARRGKSCFQV
ncbi:hypothetical protein KL86PLE_30461 [uncultured Pleomorphomonas sp.]|uniref:Uncharacterized protein n=1 Tax=uncultured Pleomorphomonas sp. TaxID=442121 RepID=A0A212LEN1_9HYPH|nr:hypothetical protein KL86PLE_30461 [uncultured Pleomorphomonas sp.]